MNQISINVKNFRFWDQISPKNMNKKNFDKISIKVIITMQQCTPVATKFQSIWTTSDSHIKLTPYSIMNVKLAAQVLSSTVSKTLTSYEPPEAAGTAKFCLLMDSFFDIMNLRNTESHEFKENHSWLLLLQSMMINLVGCKMSS